MPLNQSLYLKRLEPQESGYTKNKRGSHQRGKYILVFKGALGLFPRLDKKERNPWRLIWILNSDGEWIGVRYVWHNTLFHPRVRLKRKYDEWRIYRNIELDEAFSLDRNVILVTVKVVKNLYVCLSSAESPSFKRELSRLILSAPVPTRTVDEIQSSCPSVHAELTRRLRKAKTTKKKPELADHPPLVEQILKNLEDYSPIRRDTFAKSTNIFKNQAIFSAAIRAIYSGKCAIRRTSLVRGHFTGLAAAHIHEHKASNNYLPSNGILLSSDLHHAFDDGFWTIDRSLHVRIHPKTDKGALRSIDGRKIFIPIKKFLKFKPHTQYLAWHRKNKYGYFLRSRNNKAVPRSQESIRAKIAKHGQKRGGSPTG